MKTLRQYNPGLLIPGVIVAAIVIVLVLALTAGSQGNSSFSRHFAPTPLQPYEVIEKNQAVTAFAGTKNGKLYFATRTPAMLFVTDSTLANGHMEASGFTVNHPKVLLGFNITVSSHGCTLYAGNLPKVYTLGVEPATDSFNLTRHLFTRGVEVDSGSYVFRSFDPNNKKTRDQVLLKAHPSKGIISIDSSTIPRLNDAGIGTDGLLHYDTLNKLLVYVSFYSNKVYLWDNNLKLVLITSTIDTLGSQQYFVGERSEDASRSTLTNTRPKKIVNSESCVANGVLYVISKVKADNENKSRFTSNAVVDCYRLKDFTYTGSFYLPDYKGEKLWNMVITNRSVIAIHSSNIIRYALPTL